MRLILCIFETLLMKQEVNIFSAIRNELQDFRLSVYCLSLLVTITVPFLLLTGNALAQNRVKAPVKLKIEDGDFSQVTVVLKNNTTGESFSLPGVAKFDLDLNMNADYIISFMKPGYITKRIAFNTQAPPLRTTQGFYPFNFEVNLFPQYDGVNIVVFNQPVGKISYNRLIDDFDYDTDYTKQIQSALKQAEEEIRKRQELERKLSEQRKKDEEKRKQEEAARLQAELKARQEADKKAADEARLQAIEDQKKKKLEEEQRVLQAKAQQEEEKRRVAIAKIEEEERQKLKAAEEEEKRKQSRAAASGESQTAKAQANVGEDSKNSLRGHLGSDSQNVAGSGDGGTDAVKSKASMGSGDDNRDSKEATGIKKQDEGRSRAAASEGYDARNVSGNPGSSGKVNTSVEQWEKLPDREVEEIEESNRTITRVTVRNEGKETIFTRVVYNWGGIFYFRSSLSISESYFVSATGIKK
jgi:hypothetical protein